MSGSAAGRPRWRRHDFARQLRLDAPLPAAQALVSLLPGPLALTTATGPKILLVYPVLTGWCGRQREVHRMPLLDPTASAGSIASRIDHQDAAAVLLALYLLAGERVFGVRVESPHGVVIHCEGTDDLELVTSHEQCLVSVKARSADISLITKEYRRLSSLGYSDKSRTRSFALVLIGPQPRSVATFTDQLFKARNLRAHRDSRQAADISADFKKRWPNASTAILDELYVRLDFPPLHSTEYLAVTARLLRKIAPLTDYTDERVTLLVLEMTAKFANARLARGSVTLSELRDLIFAFAMPPELISVPHSYVWTKYEYLSDPVISRFIAKEAVDVRSARRLAMARYRRATRGHRMMAILRGPLGCIACGGTLMANLYGWTQKGIACSDCGFSPFVSIFYACTCGHPVLLVAQPSPQLIEMMISIKHSIGTESCEHCGNRPRPERLYTRVFQLNIPWPPETFSDKTLIEASEAFGWRRGKFRDGAEQPRDVLLRETLDDS